MRFHHLHFYVEDVAFWCRWFIDKLNFQCSTELSCSELSCSELSFSKAIDGPQAANALGTFAVLKQGKIEIRLSGRQVVTEPSDSEDTSDSVRDGNIKEGSVREGLGDRSVDNRKDEVAAYLDRHPPGLADVALASDRFDRAVEQARAHGAVLTQAIHVNAQGQRQCQFKGWADLRHTLVEATVDESETANLETVETQGAAPLLQDIDHVVINVPQGELRAATDWYRRAFDLSYGQRFEIETSRSGLRSQVLVHERGSLQLPLNEPTSPASQIQEFLYHNRGAGVQHVALRSADAIGAIAHFRSRGLDLIDVPDTYYEQLPLRLDCPIEDLADVSEQRLLVDWASGGQHGMLLQTFTKPLFSVPTFFFEIIERGCYLEDGKRAIAKGFGEGNFQALFEAIERSQMDRETAKKIATEEAVGKN